ncbi:uncharacterized protein BP5553_00322 [Venustampulla echinocandica]|uniref:Fungal N-terminal domain-containing protein n=1 Tax=Venustampulla echinocandica TaxID=2656787 RepID=A0A370TXU3_9HELO|nr:uncharacterized protein BP5553_00322 [Venustampulla echinocandica]RDL40343.1 hypothetical protein BP5553_00322 [Venustampulla echinocandica]
MAEIVGIVASVGSVLKVIGSAGVLIRGITQAPHEAQQIANQLDATKATLTSLRASLQIVHRSEEFLSIWNGSTRTVLSNIKVTMEQLNAKLDGRAGSSGRRLSFWAKSKWPFEREEALILQQQLQGYMQMLGMIQNAFLQGTAQTAQESAQGIDDIISSVGSYPLSSAPLENPFALSEALVDRPESMISDNDSTIVAGDSVSQVGVERPPLLLNRNESGDTRSVRFTLQDVLPQNKLYTYGNAQVFIGGFMRRKESLGTGTLNIVLSSSLDRLWLVFQPKGMENHESRWYLTFKAAKKVLADYDRYYRIENERHPDRHSAVKSILNVYPDMRQKDWNSLSRDKILIMGVFEYVIFRYLRDGLDRMTNADRNAKQAAARIKESAAAMKSVTKSREAAIRSASRMA